MEINADFNQYVVVHGDELAWQDSPIIGVSRKMFDRIGDEVARATSLVRYDPDSQFSSHIHSGGEEFLVLDGVFQDEYGDYPAGTYIRNPPKSKHTPRSKTGCTIFVKLWQFEPEDRTQVRVNIDDINFLLTDSHSGVSIAPLYKDAHEDVRIENWKPNRDINIDSSFGAEIFVLNGSFDYEGNSMRTQSWLRAPLGSSIKVTSGSIGARVWIKTGHLRSVSAPSSERD